MAFDIPDNDVATHADQARWMSTDIDILVAGMAGVGVVNGCDVTAQGSPDMTLAVAAGNVRIAAGTLVAVTGGNVTITTADGSSPRIDLVSVSDTGTKTVTAGTANSTPKPPALPSGHIGLAMVFVPASDTAIGSAQITDKRAMVPQGGPAVRVEAPSGTTQTTSTSYVEVTSSLQISIQVGVSGKVAVVGSFNLALSTGSAVDVRIGVGVDSGSVVAAGAWAAGTLLINNVPFGVVLTGITPGAHTLKVYWKTTSNTLSIPGGTRGASTEGSWWMATPL